MEIVKKNLFLIICGMVVVVALVASWWPLGSWASDLQTAMSTRLKQGDQASGLAKTPVTIGGVGFGQRVVTEEMIDKRKDIAARMKDQTAAINQLASDANQKGRVVTQQGALVPLLGGVPADSDPYRFKMQYEKIFDSWLRQLSDPDRARAAKGDSTFDPSLALAPALGDAQKIWDERQADIQNKNANIPGAIPGPGDQGVGGAASTGMDPDFVRGFVKSRANQIAMYVLKDPFQKMAYFGGVQSPDEFQVAQSLLECWVQQDVVSAICALNVNSSVALNPIKRLDKIVIGGATLFTTGTLNASGVDPTKSMTGRVSNDRFDSTTVTVTLVAESNAINAFIQQLYLTSNAYTVLSVKLSTVDPFDAAANGYIYGSSDCVQATIVCEGLLFKEWTAQVLPKDYSKHFGGQALPGNPMNPDFNGMPGGGPPSMRGEN